MKTKISIVILGIVLAIGLLSCEYTGTYINAGIYIKLIDSNGNNLLDNKNPNAFNIDSIKIYRLLANGDIIAAEDDYNIPMNAFKGFNIADSEMHLHITNPTTKHQELMISKASNVTVYIHWDLQDIDTVYSTIYHHRGIHIVDEVYYNGKQVLESHKKRGGIYNSLNRITIVKNK